MARDPQSQSPSHVTRRDVVKGLGAGVAAAAAGEAPTILFAADKAASRPAVLGKGRHTYELVPDWPKVPDKIKLGYTHGVAVDSQDRVVLFNQSPSQDTLCIFDRDGKFIKSWGPQFDKGAHGLTLRQEGKEEFLYLCDYVIPVVLKTTLDGEVVWKLTTPPPLEGVYGKDKPYRPTNVAIAPNGDVYIADGYGQSWIHQYSAKAEYIRSWGGKGTEPGKMDCPHGLMVDRRGKEPILVVADRANVRLQTFSLDGKHLGFVTKELRYPCHFDERDGDLLIPDLHGRVTLFDKKNQLITHLGDTPDVWKRPGYPNLPPEQRVPGQFISPHSACWDSHGDLYVVEWVSDGRVTKLRRV